MPQRHKTAGIKSNHVGKSSPTSTRRLGQCIRRSLVTGVVAGVVSMSYAIEVPKARAGSFVADVCQTGGGTLIGVFGVEEELLGSASFVGGERTCLHPGQALTMQLGPNASGYMNLQGGLYVYTVPEGISISSYSLELDAYAAPCEVASGHCPGGVGQVFVDHTGELDPHYDFRDLGEGFKGPVDLDVAELSRVSSVTIGVTCDSGCPSSQEIASVAIPQAQFTLLDTTVPRVISEFGPPQSGSPLAGDAEWSFTASDPGGSGVYRVSDVVDGGTITERVIDENEGLCRTVAGTMTERTFVSPRPCPQEVTGVIVLNTNDLTDGEHSVRVYVETAAGNTTDLYDGRISVANGPTVDELPTIIGSSRVGSTLTATNATLTPRAEQEWASPVAGQWKRCVSQSDCQAIPTATDTTYVPTTADVGYALVYESIGTTKVTDAVANGLTHTTRAESVPTLPVSEASDSEPGCSSGCVSGTGGGDGGGNGGNGIAEGGPAGYAMGTTVTLSLGSLTAPAPGSVSLLGDASPWKVSLSISPRIVHRYTTIKLTGRITTSPRPASGKLVYLQARKVKKQRHRAARVYGPWITFMALRARDNGTFGAAYRFRLGGHHEYEFRAVAPAEGDFRNRTGNSPVVTVRER